jgi:hypothetical protein
VVVPPDHPDLLEHLSRELGADPEIALVIDRRRGERRRAREGQMPDDRRRADRRRPIHEGETLRWDGVVIAVRAEALEAAPPTIPPPEGDAQIDAPALAEARARIAQWVRESQGVLGAVPTLMVGYRAVVTVARALERRGTRLATELRALRREHQRLWADRAALLRTLERAIPRDRENGRDQVAGGLPPPEPAGTARERSDEAAVLIAAVRERSERMLGGVREAKQALGLPTPTRAALCPRCASVVRGPAFDTRWACVVCAWVGAAPIESPRPV